MSIEIIIQNIRTWKVWFNPFFSPCLYGLKFGENIVKGMKKVMEGK